MIGIQEITFSDYLMGSRLLLPPLGSYYVHQSFTKDGILLGALTGDQLVGIVVIEFTPQPLLTYVFVEEKYRRQSIGTQLIKVAMIHARGMSKEVIKACVISQIEYGYVTDHMLSKIGFEILDTATIIRYANDTSCSRGWTEFMEKRGKRVCQALIERGFKTLPFSEASSEIFDRLKASIGREFQSNLDPFSFINNQYDRLVPEYSFVTLKNGEPVAFATVTTVDDKTLVFQQLSTALNHRGSGAFLLPFVAFMERFLQGDAYSKVAASISDSNDRMQKVVHSFIGSLAESMKTQNNYKANYQTIGKD